PLTSDGPATRLFKPLALRGNAEIGHLEKSGVAKHLATEAAKLAPRGDCVFWGIPLRIGRVIAAAKRPVEMPLKPFTARWLVFMHATDAVSPLGELVANKHALPLGDQHAHIADYVVTYADGSQARHGIRLQNEINAFKLFMGIMCFAAVSHVKRSSRVN